MADNLDALLQKQVADLLIAEVEAAYLRNEFGVIAQDAGVFDRGHFVSQLANLFAKAKKRIRVALIGEGPTIASFAAHFPMYAELVTSDEEVAVQWRNKHLKTIFVIANGPLSKQGSLNEFTTLSEQHLIARMCSMARDRAEVIWLRTLWDALSSSRGPGLSLSSIVTFALTLDQFSPSERSVKASAALYALGLFPDAYLTEESSESRISKRLKQNAVVLGQVCNAGPEDQDRIAAFCRQQTGSQRSKFNSIRKRLGRINQRSTDELAGIELTDVQTLWRGKVVREDDDRRRDEGRRQGKVPVESVAAELLLEGKKEQLKDLADAVQQVTDQAEDEQLPGDSETLVGSGTNGDTGAPLPVVDVSSSVILLAKSRSTDLEWGGVIDIEADRLEALTEVAAFKAWRPFEFDKFRALLQEFAEAELAPRTAVDIADSLAAARRELLKYISELATSPITVLAGRSEVLSAAEKFLDGYDQLLKQIEAAYSHMYADAGEEAEAIVHWLLSIELYVYRRDGEITDAFKAYHELCERLADYPILNEEDYSRREYEATLENITDSAWQLKNEYELPDGWEPEVFSWFWDHNQSAVENKDEQGGYPSEDDLRAAFAALGYEQVED